VRVRIREAGHFTCTFKQTSYGGLAKVKVTSMNGLLQVWIVSECRIVRYRLGEICLGNTGCFASSILHYLNLGQLLVKALLGLLLLLFAILSDRASRNISNLWLRCIMGERCLIVMI
jgi:hypothetical protein